MSLVASARMYAWSASLAAAWRRLLAAIIARAGVDVSVLDEHDPTPLDELWQRRDLGCAFMCGYPLALRPDRPRVLASPVPSPPRYGGRAVYVTDFIVRHDSPYTRLEETFGKTIAYSTEHSHSGYNAPRYHLLAYRTPERPTLYGAVLGPLVRQRPVLDAVVDGRADVAAIDGYAFDLLSRHAPEVAGRVRVIATTIPAPSAPLVASPEVPQQTCDALTVALLEAQTVPELRPTLDALLLSRFVRVDPRELEVFLDRERAAQSAGYPKLA
jgi:ABC-type phosphate/phosphonate transport system substrate-binding protein